MKSNLSRRELFRLLGTGAALLGVAGTDVLAAPEPTSAVPPKTSGRGASHLSRVVADPAKLPGPITRDHAVHHDITLNALEVVGEIEPGATYDYMTFSGPVPGPMLRVRQCDAQP